MELLSYILKYGYDTGYVSLNESPRGAKIPVKSPYREWLIGSLPVKGTKQIQKIKNAKDMATTTATNKKKRLKDEIYSIIRNDIPLRHKIASALNIEVDSVYQSAVRSSTKFSLPFILNIISEHTGKPKEDLIDE